MDEEYGLQYNTWCPSDSLKVVPQELWLYKGGQFVDCVVLLPFWLP